MDPKLYTWLCGAFVALGRCVLCRRLTLRAPAFRPLTPTNPADALTPFSPSLTAIGLISIMFGYDLGALVLRSVVV